MERGLYSRIIREIAALEFSGRLSFHHYNEPLLRKDLPNLVKEAASMLPYARRVLYTNGDLLTDKVYHQLLDAGIDQFFITNHGRREIPQRPFQLARVPGSFRLSSRGGLVDAGDGIDGGSLPCFAPSEMLIIRHSGQVVLCHDDATGEVLMGDLRTQSVSQIWWSEDFQRKRALLEFGGRSTASTLCARCNNRLHPLPDTAI
jgi:2-deoxy-scyllo-inosamine dehydrogenase (SAM-dependent)